MFLSRSINKLNVGVVGGSIAGCAAAVLCQQLGASVTILERSPHPLINRGAGVVLPEELIQQCVRLNLLDKNLKRLPVMSRTFYVRTPEQTKKPIWNQRTDIAALSWGDIYSNLRRRVPDAIFKAGEEIQSIQRDKETYLVKSSNGNQHEFDFLIAADGIDSVVRKHVFPECTPRYAQYIAWRGIASLDRIDSALFENHIPYFAYPNGHILLYLIPSLTSQKHLVNWVMYEDYRDKSLSTLLTDKNNVIHNNSLPPGSLTKKHLDYLKNFAFKFLPSEVARIITQTENPFIQAIFDLQIPHYAKNRICFLGDAACVLRPHSTSGLLKAITDAIQLASALDSKESVSESLLSWDQSQISNAEKQVALAKCMGEGLVTNTPDWNEMNPMMMEQWWKNLMSGKSWYATDRIACSP